MASNRHFSVTLPADLAEQLRAKVASGDYATESEVIGEGLRALQARERATETWLQVEVLSAYDAMKSDPSRARSIAEIRTTLAAAHGQARENG